QPGASALFWIFGAIIVGIIGMFLLMRIPTRARKPVVLAFTFLSGAFYVIYYLWPSPISYSEGKLPHGFVDSGGYFLHAALPKVADIANVLTFLLYCLGVYSLTSIHTRRVFKQQKDWGFSVVLLIGMVAMASIGYWDYILKEFNDPNKLLTHAENWTAVNYAYDLMFDGMIQQMDAAMFSMIAFFILSAAYRAFRIRSIEATVMMASALILMLSLMGAVDYLWTNVIHTMTHNDPNNILNNLRLDVFAGWVKANMQIPSIRALDFGVGLGALAMGLRIWLGLERGGVSV
ncbi:MAG TPA: hypothetical protein VNI20_14015, partial [Fimbriimonadaceae bacterium]|nr:hypothetical protein [Fimbriimonadaceae bacterium]